MTKEELLREFLLDDLVEDKGHITRSQASDLKFSDHSESKLVAVIKAAILGKANGESIDTIARKLNQILNK